MPQLDNVSVTNNNTAVTWVTGQQATAPDPAILPYDVYVNASKDNQPPVGFLNNPLHQFTVQGNYIPSGQAFMSAPLMPNSGLSDPPLVYVFS
jgi:hypothetical protein